MTKLCTFVAMIFALGGVFSAPANADSLSFSQAEFCVDLVVDLRDTQSEIGDFVLFLDHREPGSDFRYFQTKKGAASIEAIVDRLHRLKTYGKVLLPWELFETATGFNRTGVSLSKVEAVYLQILDGLGTEGIVVADEMFASGMWAKETVKSKAGERFAEVGNMSKKLLNVCEFFHLENK